MGVSVGYTPGAGTAPAGASVVLMGISVDVAVVTGGYALRFKEATLGFSESWAHNHPAMHEVLSMLEEWSADVTKVLEEGLAFGETWIIEPNPPLEILEGLALSEAWSLDATKEYSEALTLGESWVVEKNGVQVFP